MGRAIAAVLLAGGIVACSSPATCSTPAACRGNELWACADGEWHREASCALGCHVNDPLCSGRACCGFVLAPAARASWR